MATNTNRGAEFPLFPGEDVEYQATRPIPLHERTPKERFETALFVIESNHKRIHTAITAVWGHKECSAYMKKLILSGGFQDGKDRVGFKPEVVSALLVLDDIHDAQFGAL